MSTKPQDILGIMDIAKTARENGDNFIPCFRGDAGIGKSQIVHQWAKQNGYELIDLRLALLEAPDLLGFPEIDKDEQGRARTNRALPDFWPSLKGSKGVLFLDELNRADASVTNGIMQLLTERMVGNEYQLPDGWLMATAINGDSYDVNTMDAALADRVTIFDVAYDNRGFLEYMKDTNFDSEIQAFIKSGNWTYKTPEEIGDDGHYVSPRSWARMNVARKCNLDNSLHFKIAVSTLGKGLGREFNAFCTDQRPLYAEDFNGTAKQIKAQLKILKGHAGDKSGRRRDDLIGVTVDSLLSHVNDHGENSHVTKDLVADVALIIPTDQSLEFLKRYVTIAQKNVDSSNFLGLKDFILNHRPELKEYIEGRLKGNNNE